MAIVKRRRPRSKARARLMNAEEEPRKISPTPELEAKMKALAEGCGTPNGHKLCGYPLGYLLAHQAITRADHDAGIQFTALYRGRNGNPFPLGVSIEGRGGGGARSEKRQGQINKQYRKAKHALLQCGHEVANIVEEIAVYENFGLALDRHKHESARVGLARLKRHFRGA